MWLLMSNVPDQSIAGPETGVSDRMKPAVFLMPKMLLIDDSINSLVRDRAARIKVNMVKELSATDERFTVSNEPCLHGIAGWSQLRRSDE